MQAIPLQGSRFGEPGDFRGMSVKVAIRRLKTISEDVEAPV